MRNDKGRETIDQRGSMQSNAPAIRDLLSLYGAFLKLGLFTIGGGLAMIPQMQQVACEEHDWLTKEEVVDCIAVSQSLPGVVAINMATYIGQKLYGLRGSLVATLGVATPSFVIIVLAVLVLGAIGDNPWLAGAFTGVKAAVCALIAVSAVRLGRQILHRPLQWTLMAAALAAVVFLGLSAVWVVLGAGLIGIGIALWQGRKGSSRQGVK